MPQKQHHGRLGAGKSDLLRLRRPATHQGNGGYLVRLLFWVVLPVGLALSLGRRVDVDGWESGGVV